MARLGYRIIVDRQPVAGSILNRNRNQILSAEVFVVGEGIDEPIEIVPRIERELTAFELSAIERLPGGWVNYLKREAIQEGGASWSDADAVAMGGASVLNLHRRRARVFAASLTAAILIASLALVMALLACSSTQGSRPNDVASDADPFAAMTEQEVLAKFETRTGLARSDVAGLFQRAEALRVKAVIPWALRYYGHGPVDPQGRSNEAWCACDRFLSSWPDDVLGMAIDSFAQNDLERRELRYRLINREAR